MSRVGTIERTITHLSYGTSLSNTSSSANDNATKVLPVPAEPANTRESPESYA